MTAKSGKGGVDSLIKTWDEDKFIIDSPSTGEKADSALPTGPVVVPSPAAIALTEQMRQWRARMIQPFPVVRADDDGEQQTPEKPAGETGEESGGEQQGGEEQPPAADDIGELNKELIAAELELEFAQKDYRTAQRKDGQSPDSNTSGMAGMLELGRKVETCKKRIIKLQRQLEIVNAQSIAVPTPAEPDPNAAAAEQQDKQLQAQSESESVQQEHEEVTQLAEQAHEQSLQQAEQAHEIALAQKTSETELQKEQIKAKAQVQAQSKTKADSAVYEPTTVRADKATPVMADNTPIMKTGAGVLFITDGGRVLLGLRAEPGEYCNHWGIFGGHAEPGETLEMTAIREVLEETGHSVALGDNELDVALPPPLQLIAQTVVDGTVFTYFVNMCSEPFNVLLNEEHYSSGWYAMGEEPQPVIPGLSVVLNSPEVRALRLKKMNERDIAQAMSYGCLPSPTKYANMSMYRMRVTGTGRAFRRGDGKKIPDEYVIRPPELYLNQDFVDRCNGLDVIYEHPKKRVLDSKEYADRKVGTVMLAYIAGDEVWCVAKIYDTDTITILDNERMSTSPSVVFGDKTVNSTIQLSNGSQLLIEGKPTLLDHLAICEVGVWDKGGEPRGIESDLVGRVK